MKLLVLMISIGDRAWAKKSFSTFQSYYKSHENVALSLVTSYPQEYADNFPDLPKKPGRPNKKAYAFKSYAAWHAMEFGGYDKVLVVDDTCCLNQNSPNIFECVPQGYMGYTLTDKKHAADSFDFIKKENLSSGLVFNAAFYANSGVVVYDKKFKNAFSLESILSAKELLFARYPHQTLLYYLMQKNNIDLVMLDKRFNSIPGVSLPKEERRSLKSPDGLLEHIFMSHITGAFRYREEMVNACADYYLESLK